jgi:hypothetical protein
MCRQPRSSNPWLHSALEALKKKPQISPLLPKQGDEKRLDPATTLYGTVALSFVIPSEAEGSAVPRTFRGNVFRPQRSVTEKSAASLRLPINPTTHQFEIVLCSTFSMWTSLTLRDMAMLKSSTFFSSNIGEFAPFGVLTRKNSAPFTLSR